MTCPGFTVLQKSDIADLIGLEGDRIREFGQPWFGDRWRHQYSTSVKAGIPLDLVEVSCEFSPFNSDCSILTSSTAVVYPHHFEGDQGEHRRKLLPSRASGDPATCV